MISLCGRLPVLCADDGQAHLALLVYVGVVNLGLKANLGRLEGILGRKVDLDAEGAFVVWRVVLQAIELELVSNIQKIKGFSNNKPVIYISYESRNLSIKLEVFRARQTKGCA